MGRPWAITALDPRLDEHEAATSILVYGEVTEYLRGLADSAKRRAELRRQLAEIRPYALTYAIMERYADIRRQLRPPHGPRLIGDVDTLIAATALERDLTIVTLDSDFRRVPNLRVLLLSRAP